MRRGEDIDVGHDSVAVDFDICYLGGGEVWGGGGGVSLVSAAFACLI